MRRTAFRSTVMLLLAGLAAGGCSSAPVARYVYQDGQFGVIGIPKNTSFGEDDFQAQAHALMARHFPDGYEIVRAEEVVEGQRFLDAGKKTELATDPTISALNQMLKIGQITSSRSIEQKDTIPILESRIIYKRKTPGEPAGANGFATLSSSKPEFYLDPNDMTRCKSLQILADAKQDAPGTKPGDPAVLKSSHDEKIKK